MIKRILLLGLIFFIAGLGIYFVGIPMVGSVAYLHEQADVLRGIVESHYWLSLLIYVLVFMLATIFFIPITVFCTVTSGLLFGVLVGSVVTLFAATVGAVILFLFIRYAIGGRIQKKYANQLIHFNAEVTKHGARYLLALQWLPFTPTPLINLLAGVSVISLWSFVWSTVIGLLPGTVMYTWIGYQLRFVQTPIQGVELGLAIVLLFAALVLGVPLIFRWIR